MPSQTWWLRAKQGRSAGDGQPAGQRSELEDQAVHVTLKRLKGNGSRSRFDHGPEVPAGDRERVFKIHTGRDDEACQASDWGWRSYQR